MTQTYSLGINSFTYGAQSTGMSKKTPYPTEIESNLGNGIVLSLVPTETGLLLKRK